MSSATIVATLARIPRSADEFRLMAQSAGWIEVRGDLGIDLTSELRRGVAAKTLFSLRSIAAGGRSDLPAIERQRRLIDAAERYDMVELEAPDLVPPVLRAIDPSRRVLSGHARQSQRDELLQSWSVMASVPAALYRLTAAARTPGEELAPLFLLRELRRHDVAAFATGRCGGWTRLVAPRLGAPMIWGKLEGDFGEDGVPTLENLVADYGLPRLDEAHELFGICGDPIYRSLSPRLHNAAFRAVGQKALYVPFHVESFTPFWSRVVESRALDELGLPLRAMCVVSPHKEVALAATRARTHMVQRAGSTNFVIRDGNRWTADTTDPQGVLLTLRARGVDVGRRKAVVIGCGGSGRAVAAALQQAGAEVTLVNRGLERGALAVRLLRLPFLPLAGFSVARFSLIVNATPVGRDGSDPPFALEHVSRQAVVVDLVYGDRPTRLVESTRAAGQISIDGRDVLLTQARAQFRLMTGQEMPAHVGRDVLDADPVPLAAVR